MTVISQSGTLNTSSLSVPDLYIQIQTSGTTSLSGAQTDIIGIVGTSSWGPKNTPLVFGTSAERVAYFGSMQDTPFDLATIASTAILQGASNFVGVRVTDGTDTVGSAPVLPQSENEAYPVLISSKYTGSESNNISFNISTGSAPKSWKITVSMPNYLPEIFDNIIEQSDESVFWNNFVSAINN